MLASLGPVVFNLRTDLQTIDQDVKSSFAKHDVMGASPVYENTGDDESTVTLKGTLHPYFFGGALSGLAALEAARQAKTPLPLMRGDYAPMGWFLIDKISRSDAELDAFEGIGHEIDYTVDLLRVDSPGAGIAETLLRLFL
jgi:phage protein U